MTALFVCLVYLELIAGAELITITDGELLGVMAHFVILLGLMISSALAGPRRGGHLFLAMGLVSLTRIASLSVPTGELSQISWYLIISLPILVGTIAVIRRLGLYPRDIGLSTNAFAVQVVVALTGTALGFVQYLILEPEPLIDALRWQEIIVPALILMLATGFVEELVFRGVIQYESRALGQHGWTYVAVLYALLQIGHGSVDQCLFAFGVMLYYGLVVKKTGSILGVSISHGLINVGLYLIFPFMF